MNKQLTVSELIELLKPCPQDALVWHEGCDCWGQADRVEVIDDKEVLIGRWQEIHELKKDPVEEAAFEAMLNDIRKHRMEKEQSGAID